MDDYTSTTTTNRRRRRALTWGLFGVTGILMSAAWATGFATSDSNATGTGPAADVFGSGAVDRQSLSDYQDDIAEVDGLAITFDGLWGQIAADTVVYKIDLVDDPGTFYVDIYVDNLPFDEPWSAAQLKWHQFDDCDDTPPAWDDVDGDAAVADPGAPKLMNIFEADAHVSFPALTGGNADSVYCFGISSTNLVQEIADGVTSPMHADDELGTFLTRPSEIVEPTAPDFVAIVNKSGA